MYDKNCQKNEKERNFLNLIKDISKNIQLPSHR